AEFPATALLAFDHDNDGRTDLLAWGPDGVRLLRSEATGFRDVSERLPSLQTRLTQALARDCDGDGDLDLVTLADGRLHHWENCGGEANASLQIALLAEFDQDGTDPKRCNHRGLGSLLELRRGPIYQAAVVQNAVTHLGLGPQADGPAGEALRVLWTNGIPETIREPTDGAICHPQKLGGSCPYLYTWNGERFVFATDLCWAAPIGLQWAEGVFAPTRDWEYVKIDGEALTPHDGFYDLRICCELWEAEYFDQVELICVDHPPNTHVFTNEKVGPPELVEPHLYLTEALREPAAAKVLTKGGGWREELEIVSTRDETYLKPFATKRTQGFTEPWVLELDLDGAPRDGAVLLLTGWVFPTDTGLNVALGQNPDRSAPRPPTLSMETTDGWRVVLPNAGFPGGKTKTIALPLPAFPSAHRRVRLEGTQELYWDRIAWCVPDDVEFKTASADVIEAKLRYRGFSARRWPTTGNGPDQFDYQTVSPAPLWPPMSGPFTRYGEVAELLTDADDKQVVLASGDEMALRFAVPPLRAGWTRDFVLHSVGYDKDANLHTVHGQGVLPMPHAGMRRYPPPPDRPFLRTPAMQEYWEEYQTRPGDGRRFWRSLKDGTP
ncbi:MAG: FG-GAP-like repeat-containing protein, partial [Planctomycetota bacterium]